MISKMKPVEEGGSRLAIVFNGSPLFTGAAGSGESEIRRWIIENDWLEAVVALPDQLFYNTGISTYFWVVTNRKRPERRGKVQLVDAREFFDEDAQEPREKRKRSSPEQIDEITRLYGEFAEGEKVKILPNEAFGFLRITVERPLRLRYEVTEDTSSAADQRQYGSSGDSCRTENAERHQGRRANQRTLDERYVKRPVATATVVRTCEAVEKSVVETHSRARPPRLRRSRERRTGLSLIRATRQRKRALPADPVHRLRGRSDRPPTSVSYYGAVEEYFAPRYCRYARELVRDTKTKLGYEIPLTRHFYRSPAPAGIDPIACDETK